MVRCDLPSTADTRYKPRVRLPASLSALCAALAIAALTQSCNSVSRISVCSRVTGLINTELAKVAELYARQNVGPDEYAEIGRTYQSLELQLKELSLEAYPDLQQAVGGYRGTLRTTVQECQRYEQGLRAHLTADEADDRQKSMDSLRNLGHIRRRMTNTLKAYETAAQRVEYLCSVRE